MQQNIRFQKLKSLKTVTEFICLCPFATAYLQQWKWHRKQSAQIWPSGICFKPKCHTESVSSPLNSEKMEQEESIRAQWSVSWNWPTCEREREKKLHYREHSVFPNPVWEPHCPACFPAIATTSQNLDEVVRTPDFCIFENNLNEFKCWFTNKKLINNKVLLLPSHTVSTILLVAIFISINTQT